MLRYLLLCAVFVAGCGDSPHRTAVPAPIPTQLSPSPNVQPIANQTTSNGLPPKSDVAEQAPRTDSPGSVTLPTSPPPGAFSAATKQGDVQLENAIQQFVDAGIIVKTYFRNDVVRVRVSQKFLDDDLEGKNFVLRALWSYYYESKSAKTKLFVVDDANYKEIGYFDDASGYHAYKPSVAMENHGGTAKQPPNPATNERHRSYEDVIAGFPSFSAGSRSVSSGGVKDVFVHGYYRKNGTYVHSHMRSSPRR